MTHVRDAHSTPGTLLDSVHETASCGAAAGLTFAVRPTSALLASVFQVLGFWACAIMARDAVLGIKPRTSCTLGKHSAT